MKLFIPSFLPHAALAALVAVSFAGCGGAPVAEDRPAGPISSAPGTPEPAVSAARTLAAYKLEAAQHLQRINASLTYSGAPPHELRSIIVVNVVIDASGGVRNATVFRDNGDPETRSTALATVQRAAPYPRPAPAVLRGGQVQFTETWLFRDDGRFVLRSLAEAYQQ